MRKLIFGNLAVAALIFSIAAYFKTELWETGLIVGACASTLALLMIVFQWSNAPEAKK